MSKKSAVEGLTYQLAMELAKVALGRGESIPPHIADVLLNQGPAAIVEPPAVQPRRLASVREVPAEPTSTRKPRRRVSRAAGPPKPSAVVMESEETDWTKVQKRCPRCDKTKPVVPGFGVTPIRKGEPYMRPQPWCKDCRSETSKEYYAAARKYHRR